MWTVADRGFYESEPNDSPADFHAVQGEVTLYGTMVGADQDGFLWTVTDNDARKRWTFTLIGEPGALTIVDIVRLEYADNGVDVAGKRTLLKISTRDGATPAVQSDLQFEPGDYVIGLAQAGAGRGEPPSGGFRPPAASLSFTAPGLTDADTADPTADEANAASAPPPNAEPGAYRLIISEGTKLAPQPSPAGRESPESAHNLRLRGEFSTFESEEKVWYSLTFGENDTTSRWDVHLQAPLGRALRARLLDADGGVLLEGRVDDAGKLRLPDLAPAAGTTWWLELTTDHPGFIQVIATEAVGERVAGEEAEPNTDHNFANRVDFKRPVTGRIGGDDVADHFRYRATNTTADELRTLRLETANPTRIQLCLKTVDQQPVQCRDGDTPIELPDLAFAEGDWAISVGRASTETAYTLSMISQGPVTSGIEVEPNDRIEYARGLPDKLRISGRFTGTDTDFYQILIDGDPQLWRFQVVGDGLFELAYHDGSRTEQDKIRVAGGTRRMRMDNVFLLPGRHFLRVSGNDGGTYTLLARPMGPPDPNGEIEPNDQHNKQRLSIGQTRRGLSSDEGDQDFYRFFVANWDHLKLTVTPPADGLIAPNLYWYGNIIGQGQPGGPGKPLVMQGLFPPGDYHVVLEPRQASEAEYNLSLERLPRWSCPADCEPNGQGLIWLAAPLPADLILEGEAGQWRDADYYQLPGFDEPTELHLYAEPGLRVSLGADVRNQAHLPYDPELGGFKATVPAGEPRRLMIDARGPYRVQLEFPSGVLQPVVDALPIQIELELETETAAAYRQYGQRIGGAISIRNATDTPLQLNLEAATSDYRWQVGLDASAVAVSAQGDAAVPLAIRVPADAWAESVRISVRAQDASGRQVETFREVSMDRSALPVHPVLHSSVPDALRGGLNAAWLPFGAEWTADTPGWAVRTDTIRDDLVFDGARSEGPGDGNGWDEGEHPILTLDLPGDEPVLRGRHGTQPLRYTRPVLQYPGRRAAAVDGWRAFR